ncbi:RNA-binding protein [bacterium]|nr:RNA-binding protein [bacterium]
MNIYVGNLDFKTTEDELREAFSVHGAVDSCRIITDKMTGRPKGFAFIEMEDAGARAAIAALDGQQLGSRTIKVNESQPREDRPRGGGGGRGGYGGGGDRGYGGGGGGGRW